jgi:cytochrome c-type biogenesis protein CcmE
VLESGRTGSGPESDPAIIGAAVDPSRKRHIRLVLALSAAVLLAAALVYTSFSAGSKTVQPSELTGAEGNGVSYELGGRVVEGTGSDSDRATSFQVEDVEGGSAIDVEYTGQVPDPFRDGREVIVTGTVDESGTFVADKDSLVTKCPSKFTEAAEDDPNIQIVE